MADFPKQMITLYHKENDGKYTRYPLLASYRDTSILNRNNTGVNNIDDVLIRIFTSDHFVDSYDVAKDDVIVNQEVEDEIEKAPSTELSKKYGQDNVHKITTIDKFIFGEELDHVKIGAK